jgi:hypothetical protein
VPIVLSDSEASEQPYITLNDKDGNAVTFHETNKRAVARASGLLGIGAPRANRRVRPQAHGGIDNTRWEDGRIIVLEGAVFSQVSQADAWAEFNAITTPMMQTLDYGPALLKWTTVGGSLPLQRLVRLASEIDPPLEEGAAILRYQVQFYAEDPRAYSQTLDTVQSVALSANGGGKVYPFAYPRHFAISGGGTLAYTNAGSRPAPPVFRVYGQVVNPAILLLGTSDRITINGTIPNGSYLEIDVQARTLKMGGTVNQANFLDAANTAWMEAPTGVSNWQVVASSFDTSARFDLLARSAY